MSKQLQCLLLLMAGFALTVCEDCEEEEIAVIEAEHFRIQEGDEATFQCTSTLTDPTFTWYQDDREINSLNSSFISYDSDGLLTIENAPLNFTADYTCQVSNCTATLSVQVYEMPSYLTAGLIVLGIDLGLVVLFCACLAYKTVSQRRELNQYKKKYGLLN